MKGERVTEQDVFVLSEHALANVIEQIRDDQWDQTRPAWFGTGGQGDATLRQIVNYHAYDSAWVPDVLAGRTMVEVGDRYEGLKTAPDVDYREWSDRAAAAAEALDDPDKIVYLSYGDWPAREYLKHVTSFRGFRAFDIAKWIGADTRLPDDLVQGMWDEFAPDIEEWRAMGVFGSAVPVPEDASQQDRLLGLAGRDPSPS